MTNELDTALATFAAALRAKAGPAIAASADKHDAFERLVDALDDDFTALLAALTSLAD